jgi:glycogenin glucosyltransferase
MRAYITLLSTMSYLSGVIVLCESLRRVKAGYPLCVALSSNIPVCVDELLRQKGLHIIRLPPSIDIPEELKKKSGHWGNTFDKLHLFSLTGFEKLVYLDSDMMVLTNIDELFDRPHMSAVAAGRLVNPQWERLNSGLMVIEPVPQLAEEIAATLGKALLELQLQGQESIGDQDLINAYYPEWPFSETLHLDEGYNMFYWDLDSYVNQHGYYFPDAPGTQARLVRVVHFVGPHKPWMKWAGFRYLFNALKKRPATKSERETFAMYHRLLKSVGMVQVS